MPRKQAVQRVRGIRAIVQDIEVRDPATVHVEKGWVSLAGTVEAAYQPRVAEVAVRKLDGVVGVSNLIEIRTSVPTPDAQRPFGGTVDRRPEIEAGAPGSPWRTTHGATHNWDGERDQRLEIGNVDERVRQ